MKILATAKQRGAVNAIVPVIKELQSRGHEVNIYASGNEQEAAGFGELNYQSISSSSNFGDLVKNYDTIVSGADTYVSVTGSILHAASSLRIPTLVVHSQNGNHKEYFGHDPASLEYLPNIIGVMDQETILGIREELGGDLGEEAAKRCRIVGWTAFDHYARLRNDFSPESRERLLISLGIDSNDKIFSHFTQNMHPDSAYMKATNIASDLKQKDFDYEVRVTEAVFAVASDLGIKLMVKPHPGEAHSIDTTSDLVKRYGFTYIPARACNTQQLMLAADSISAGRSTCLTEACLLDRNVGGIFTEEIGKSWMKAFPPIVLGAIPYALEWNEVASVIGIITSNDVLTLERLTQERKRFSVDGKASQRVADLIELL